MTIRRSLLAAAAVLTLAPLAPRAGEVWTASSAEKIRPDATPRQTTDARLAAARNEFEAFQVVVTGPATQVRAKATLSGPAGMDPPRLYREELIDLPQPSALDGAAGRWPDALVPDVDDVVGEQRSAFPFDVSGGESRAIWVEVHVPAGAKPGTYQGEVTVSSAEGEAKVPFSLVVWDFELPSTSSLRTAFNLSYGVIPAAHGGVSGDDLATLRARYGQMGLDHRVTLTGVTDDGASFDTGHLERFYGPLFDGTAPTQLQGAKATALKYMGSETSVDDHKQWASFARSKGWFDRLFDYVCDEPPLTCAWSDIGPRAQAAHDADPDFRTLVTTQIWDAQDHGVDQDIDLLVPVINWMDDKPGSAVAGDQRARYDGWLQGGKNRELWLYQSCMSHGCGGTVNMGSPSDTDRYYTGWPSYMIDASASRNRAMEWLTFLEDGTGELYWETANAFTHDAWSNQWDFSGNGDGTLFYPGTPARIGGKTDIPVASIRLKMIREGMEDYEYLKLLSDAGDRDGARQIARDLFPNAWSTDVAPEKLEAAREALAQKILAAKGKSFTSATGASAAVSGGSGGGGGGGGCGSGGGLGGGALLALPLLLLLAARGGAARRAVRVRVRRR
jgi:glycosyl hydrolase family 123